MSDNERNTGSTPLLKWFGYYIGGLAAFVLSCVIFHGQLAFMTYLVVGFSLNRLILRQLSMNPLYDTIGDVARSKLSAFFFWPLSYLVLLFQMTVNRVL